MEKAAQSASQYKVKATEEEEKKIMKNKVSK